MKSLTLEQVKQAGRFAWSDRARLLFVSPTGLIAGNGSFDYDDAEFHRATYWTSREPLIATGWQHLPGCDCQFCAEAGE